MFRTLFLKDAAVRWSEEDKEYIKNYFIQQREKNIPHSVIFQTLADKFGRSYTAVKQLIERMFKTDEQLRKYKFESWSREKIIKQLQDLYLSGRDINRSSLPRKLEFQITNHSLPKAEKLGFEVWFNSVDDAIAEAILNIGFERDENGKLVARVIDNLDQARQFYRRTQKKSHAWTKEEILQLFREADELGLPVTIQFFADHANIYKSLLKVNRSLEGLKWSVLRHFDSWGDAVVQANIVTKDFYDETGKPLGSTEELRVSKFLSRNNIPYRRCTIEDKIVVDDEELLQKGYKAFIPDFVILDDYGNMVAIVEVFGGIADSLANNGTVGSLYREKMDAKQKVYSKLSIEFIPIYNNSIAVELDDESLKKKFDKFIKKPVNDEKIAKMQRVAVMLSEYPKAMGVIELARIATDPNIPEAIINLFLEDVAEGRLPSSEYWKWFSESKTYEQLRDKVIEWGKKELGLKNLEQKSSID